MNKIIAFLIIWTIALPFSAVCAQENTEINDDFESRLLSIKNPYKSQLPKVEGEEAVITENPNVNKRPLKTTENQTDNSKMENEPGSDKLAFDELGSTDPSPETSEIIEPPQVEEIIPMPDVTVSGIIWNSDRPQAIINERVIDIGDTILGIEITEIRKTGVSGLFHGEAVIIKHKGASYE